MTAATEMLTRKTEALRLLYDGPMLTGQMSSVLGIKSTEKTRIMLERMQEKGLVASASHSSRRTYWWEITEAGRAALSEGLK